MPLALTPRLLRRGLELFAVISLIGVLLVLVFFGENLQGFLSGLAHLRWGWMLLGLGLASMDWLGGGTRLWVVARQVHPGVRLRDMVIAGGMSAWAAYLTPFQTGAGPTMMWVMRRAGIRLPEAMTSTFMTFVATVIFFAVAGPLAIYLGAGKSLAEHNLVLGITYYGLFRASLRIFGVIGVVMLVTMIDRKSTRLNSSHLVISYAVFCLKKKKTKPRTYPPTSSGDARLERINSPRVECMLPAA